MREDGSGDVVIISGGASGIGLATAEVLAAAGRKVALLDLDAGAARSCARGLSGSEHLGLRADVTNTDSVVEAVEIVEAELGRIDGVVACAGVVDPSPSETVTDDSLRRLIDIHLLGTVRLARATFPALARSPHGALVAMSSMGARLGVPQRLGYNAAKAGIEGVIRTLAVEWVGHGIRANAVAPGWVKTPAIARLIGSGFLDPTPIVDRTPAGRFAEPDEIADVIAFLLNPRSSYLTGQSIAVDGGMTIQCPAP